MILSNSFVLAAILSGAVMAKMAAVEPALNKNANEIAHKHKPQPDFHGKKNGYNRQEADEAAGDDDLKVNHGWSKFFFKGGNGAVAGTNYIFKTKSATTLSITDAYCSGDSFLVYNHGQLILETPFVGSDNCATYEKHAGKAASSGKFSSGSIALESGHHNITIQTSKNPFGKGAAFIRLDAVLAKCPNSANGLTVINTPVPFHQASHVCKSMGLDLANIDSYNFVDATNLAFQCSGAFSKTWIKSWWMDQYNGTCLALSTGASAPGGSINPAEDCNEALPVLCQVVLLEEGQCGENHQGHHNHNHYNNYYSNSNWDNNDWNNGEWYGERSSSNVEVVYDQYGNVLPIQEEIALEELDTSSITIPDYNECYLPKKPHNWKSYSSTVEWHGPYKPKPCRKPHCKPHHHGHKSSSSSSHHHHHHHHHETVLPPTLSSSSWVWKKKNAKAAEAGEVAPANKKPLFANRAQSVRAQNNAAAGTINVKPFGKPFGKMENGQAAADAAPMQPNDFVNAKQPLIKNPFKKPNQN